MGVWLWPLFVLIAAAIDCSIYLEVSSGLPDRKGVNVKKTLETFRTSIPGAQSIPDPLKIYSVSEWYILDAVSEMLIRFDHESGKYVPVLAESWTFDGDELRMKIKPGLLFHDGSPLGVTDIVASFQRVIRQRSSTHYQIWQNIPNCRPGDCPSIRAEGDTLVMKYQGSKESLFMFLSCPESAVWSAHDTTQEPFTPTRYSGFFYPVSVASTGIELRKNSHNVRTSQFSKAPLRILGRNLAFAEGLKAFHAKELDALLVAQTPFNPFPFPVDNYQVHKTVPLALNYLLKMKTDNSAPFSRKFLEILWRLNIPNEATVPAFGVLPPGVEGGLTRDESLSVLPEHPKTAKVKIGVLTPFHSTEFATMLKSAGESAGMGVEIVQVSRETFFDALSNPASAPFDYLLSAYLASDKFPLTQLKLIANHHPLPAEGKEEMPRLAKIELLRNLQGYLLERQITIPLFYASATILAQDFVSLGQQPVTDSDLQLWRINEDIPD